MVLEPSSDGIKGRLEFRYQGPTTIVRESARKIWPDGYPVLDEEPDCKNQIEMGVQVLFSSANGALNENWEGRLIAPLAVDGTTQEPDPASFRVVAECKPVRFQGTTQVVKLPEREGQKIAQHRVQAQGLFKQGALESFSLTSKHVYQSHDAIISAGDIEHYIFKVDQAP